MDFRQRLIMRRFEDHLLGNTGVETALGYGQSFWQTGRGMLGIEDQYWHNKFGTDGGRDVAIHRDK